MGDRLFGPHLVDIGALKHQEFLRSHESGREHVGDLLTERIAIRVHLKCFSVPGLVRESPDGYLTLEGFGHGQGRLALRLCLLSRGNGSGNYLLWRRSGCAAGGKEYATQNCGGFQFLQLSHSELSRF
jgi:hypothetical protein